MHDVLKLCCRQRFYEQQGTGLQFVRGTAMAGFIRLLPFLLFIFLNSEVRGCTGFTSPYVRRLAPSVDLPLDSPHFAVPNGYNAPQQVHTTQGDYDGQAIIVSWVTPSEPGASMVSFGQQEGNYEYKKKGSCISYKFANYTSGFIHHVKIGGLQHNVKYYYKVGSGNTSREFWFITPPASSPDEPYTFGLIGDLGQTYDSAATLNHYLQSKGQALLYLGDLSYADNYPYDDNNRWDTWGRLVEPSTAYQAWIWTAGNHELEFRPQYGETYPFKPYLHRYHTPFRESGSTSSLWYAFRRASAHIIVLSSYSAYGTYAPQTQWLMVEFTKVNRSMTPWLIVLMHSPLYNSNLGHYYEGESMRVAYESSFVKHKVDAVFAGHVHAYERSYPVSNIKYNIVNGECNPLHDPLGPVYLTVGDGGNIEGLSIGYQEPQPEYSAYREASFGHGLLEIFNRTHAHFSWHRNQDGEDTEADSYMLLNKYWS